jgi:CheY-like chemotaxis protein
MNQECDSIQCKGQYKLILMDLGMPIKDGFKASEEIFKM